LSEVGDENCEKDSPAFNRRDWIYFLSRNLAAAIAGSRPKGDRAYFTRRLKPAGFSFAFAVHGAMLTGEPFNRTVFGTAGTTREPN
jgi:hypothetical protein